MRVKPYKPRNPPGVPKVGEYWIVEYIGHRHVMKMADHLERCWARCGTDFLVPYDSVTLVKRVKV